MYAGHVLLTVYKLSSGCVIVIIMYTLGLARPGAHKLGTVRERSFPLCAPG